MKLSYKYYTFHVPLCFLLWLKRRMRWVRAAGGIVEDADGRRLLILRNGRYDLPKGKVEDGETLQQAALREVQEETGLSVLSVQRSVFSEATQSGGSQLNTKHLTLNTNHYPLKTYHVYNLYGGWHLKQTSWFKMTAEGFEPATNPQREEGITDCLWVDCEDWRRKLKHSYGTMRAIAKH